MEEKNISSAELIVIQGIPGAGASYTARRLLKQYGTTEAIIVSRDSIRNSLGDYWVSSRETLVTFIEDYTISNALSQGYKVIVDGPNLNPRTVQTLEITANTYDVPITYEILKVSPMEAFLAVLWRTLLGGRFVSYKIIKGFYNRYKDIIGV